MRMLHALAPLLSLVTGLANFPTVASAMPRAFPTYPKFLGPVIDRDIGGPARLAPPPGATASDLTPDRIEVTDDPSALTILVFREEHGQPTPVPGLNFSATTARGARIAVPAGPRGFARAQGCANPSAGGPVTLTAILRNEHLDVTNGRATYRIVAQAPCRGVVKLHFRGDTNGGQATGIWQVAHRAEVKVGAEIGFAFWSKPIRFNWPADGDYFNWGSVNLTRGDHWDVVGHEMGHAIYDLGNLGQFGGGEHKIDQCYSDALALSEGWASYFSAWVSVDPRDPDAKFEYMVPRRAPIRFENIPTDVCRGSRNEWRVTGFFWDLYDLHDDGETAAYPFKASWDALFNRGARDMRDVRAALEAHGFDPRLVQTVWDLNF